ncbi:MAG: terminase [Armatimonadia bacterium]
MAKQAEKPKAGKGGERKAREPVYDPAKFVDEICDWIAQGKTLRDYCRQEGKPHYTVVYEWRLNDDEFAQRFARARDIGHDAIAEECLAIADESAFDAIEGEDGTLRTNSEVIQRSKLRVETRLKLLAKWSPKKYGDKLDVNHSGHIAQPTDLTDDQLAAIAAGSSR